MPTYDYECPKCARQTEVFHGMMEKPRVKCPECSSRMRKRLGTGAGIIFKGSGFYETDYRSESYKASAKADSGKPADAKGAKGSGAKGKSGDSTAGNGSTATAPSTGAAQTKSPPPASTSGPD